MTNRISFIKRLAITCLAAASFWTGKAHAQVAPPATQWVAPDDCDPITGCPPVISLVDYNGWKAYRLTDGRNSEAVIVPQIGRVMRFAKVGGPNWLWNAAPETQQNKKPGDWKNWGGDKTWPAPQSSWSTLVGQAWPPDAAWDGLPHTPEVLTGGRLRTTSEISSGSGARIVREYWFDEKTGEFVISQTVSKECGAPNTLSIWSVTQIAPPDAVFLPLNPQSDYPEKYHWLRADAKPSLSNASPAMLRVLPAAIEAGKQKSFKIGVDSPVAAIAAVKDGVAFVQRAGRPEGTYPDGATNEDGTAKSGFPVELYDSGQSTAHYMELELLSPMLQFTPGTRWTHTMRWKLQQLSGEDTEDAGVQAEVEKLLQ